MQKELFPELELSPLEVKALGIVGDRRAKKVRELLKPGLAQPVDFTVRVRGSVDVGKDDQSATITDKPALPDVLAIVFHSLGPKTTANVVEALQMWRKRPANFAPEPETLALVERLLNGLSIEVRQPKRGSVTGCLDAVLIARTTDAATRRNTAGRRERGVGSKPKAKHKPGK